MKIIGPPLGAFIRPVGHYAYCLQSAEINTYPTGQQCAYKRWAIKNGQPFDDGHCLGRSFLNDLVYVVDGAWKQPAFNGYAAVYWKLINIKPPESAQGTLFN